ncbi:UspA domain protein [Candidatus Magnetoovum chiemensis]|nr:UspA domain protein [Candidatus Magnetoovum chiemensis]
MKILCAVNGSERSFNALRSACRIAVKNSLSLNAFYVNSSCMYCPELTRWSYIERRIEKEQDALSAEIYRKNRDIGKEFNINIDCLTSSGEVDAEINAFLNENGIYKMLVIGHNNKSIFSENIVKNIIVNCNIPVLTTSSDFDIKRILLSIEDENTCEEAVKPIAALTKSSDISVTLMIVYPSAEEEFFKYSHIAGLSKINERESIRDMQSLFNKKGDSLLKKLKYSLSAINITPANIILREGNWANETINEATNHDLLVICSRNKKSATLNPAINEILYNHWLNILLLPSNPKSQQPD